MRRLVEDSHFGEEPDRSGGPMPAASELFKFKRLALSVGLSTDGNDSGPSRIRAVRIGLRQGNWSNVKVSRLRLYQYLYDFQDLPETSTDKDDSVPLKEHV
jgi:hypothetical protein